MGKSVYDDVVVIIPVYNEAKVIRGVVEDVLKTFKHVVCINDGSSDDSAAEIAKTKAFLVNHAINMGQGAALQTGIEFARMLPAEYFVTYDADGQHRIEDAKSMVDIARKGDVDIVFGSRFKGRAIGMPKVKRLVFSLAIWFSNITSGLKLSDTHNGLRVFNRYVAETMQITMPDMTHASEILEITAKKRYRYTEIPVVIEYTDYSRGKGQSIINAVNIGFDTLLRKITK